MNLIPHEGGVIVSQMSRQAMRSTNTATGAAQPAQPAQPAADLVEHSEPVAESVAERLSAAQERIRELEVALALSANLAGDAREQSAHWEWLFDAISDPIGVVSDDNRLVFANAAYRTMFDRIPDGVIGHECFSAHPNPTGGPCETCPVSAAIRSHRPAFVQTERPARANAGTTDAPAPADDPAMRRVFQRWTYPVIHADGRIDEVVEIIKDVTEQERLREASRQAEALREADRLKAELLGTVSHELRSPLAAIKGYAGTLLRHDGRLPRTERHEFLSAISQASDRLEAIIDQLLLMSQLETGLITLHRAPVDLRQLAREAVIGIERRLPHDETQERSARYHFVIADHTGAPEQGADAEARAVVAGDRRLLRQALDEVLDNAVKYSPDGGLIELTLSRLPPRAPGAPPMLALYVRDEGLGIPNEQLGRIFDRFHRVEGGLTSQFGGLGLGLTICKRVIELHGGTVQVESEPGRGAVFSLLLPHYHVENVGLDSGSVETDTVEAVSREDG